MALRSKISTVPSSKDEMTVLIEDHYDSKPLRPCSRTQMATLILNAALVSTAITWLVVQMSSTPEQQLRKSRKASERSPVVTMLPSEDQSSHHISFGFGSLDIPHFDAQTITTVASVVAGMGVIAMGITLMGQSHSVELPDSYSYIVPGTEDAAKGLGAIHRSRHSKDKLVTTMPDGSSTCWENFQSGMKKNPDGPCLGVRQITGTNTKGETIAGEYVWQTFAEINERVTNFSSGLVGLGMTPELPGSQETGPLKLLALFMKNRPEWVIAEQSCYRHSASTVPMYDTLGPDVVEMIFNETELTTVVAAPSCVPALLSCRERCPSFKNLIYVDELSEDVIAQLQAGGINVYSFAEVEAKGKANPVDAKPPKPSNLATFCYTSGTTGKSKGALLTHSNLVSVTAAVEVMGVHLTPADRHLSYLPLAHIFERASMSLVLYSGARVGFYQGETLRLPDDLATLRPTFFPSVPRLLNRFYDKIFAGVALQGGLKAKLFQRAYAAKQQGLKQGKLKHPLWDKLVFSKITKRLGLDTCRYLVTGSAPIAPHVLEFLRILLGCSVMEGYGQTEAGAGSTGQDPCDFSCGNVGPPLACNEIRLVSVPDMGYNVTDRLHGADDASGNPGIPCLGRGEICFHGPNCFLGYYKMPETTADTLDKDGWVHSGDIGIWTERGQLKIVDRKKNIFKLAQGEYIAPEKIENVYTKSTIVAQAFVYGDSFQHQLVAIVIPDAEAAPLFCQEHGIPVAPLPDLCKNPTFKDAVMAEMDRVRKDAKLFGFEHAANIYLDPQPFTPENELLTPTFKLKRDVAKKHYQQQIDAMYDNLGGVAGVKGLRQ